MDTSAVPSAALPDAPSEPITEGEPLESGLNPFAPGFYDDPYVQYRHLRETDPVHHSPIGMWFLSRWDDCHQVLRQPGTSVDERNSMVQARQVALAGAAAEAGVRRSRSILGTDPPDHTRIRRLVSKAFTPRTVSRLEDRVTALVDELLDDAIARGGEIDLISELAFPLPFQVIHEMLGMPDSTDASRLRSLSQTVTQVLDPVLAMTRTEEIVAASAELAVIIVDAVEWKRGNPGDDLLTGLIQAEEAGDNLTDEELCDNVTLLYLAGHETTVNLIGNGTLALLRHPDQAALLRSDPDLDPNAIEELLRYDSPVQFSRRIALEPFTVGETTFEPGEIVLTGLGASNRDPAKFGPTAEHLDILRPDASYHISFGSGVHHCLGAALARLEGRKAIPHLFRRFPEIQLATDTPEWNGRMVLRGLAHLPVTLGPPRRRLTPPSDHSGTQAPRDRPRAIPPATSG